MNSLRHCALLLLFLLSTVLCATAQRQWDHWHFGFGASIDFGAGGPRALAGSALSTHEGSASIADPATGQLLFYTDGTTIWNREHRPMRNGGGLRGHGSATQSALIVPDPGDATRYYVFTVDALEDLLTQGMRYDAANYSIVDMTLDSGRGDVVVKNVRLQPFAVTEKLCAIRRCRDGAYWVIVHEADKPRFFAYPLTASGVGDPVISVAGSVHRIQSLQASRTSDLAGAMKSSVDGTRLAVVHGGGGPEVFDVDLETGRLKLALQLPHVDPHLYGVSFSPNGRRLYVIQNIPNARLIQYDLAAGDSAAIAASRTVLARYAEPGGSLQLGSDGRIYVAADGRQWLAAITRPNEPGTACGLVDVAVTLGGRRLGIGLPNLIDSELPLPGDATAGADTSICPGDSVRLDARGGIDYRWRFDASLSCTDCASPIVSPSVSTSYVVEITTPNGCTMLDTVAVSVLDGTGIDAGADVTLCAGDTATLNVRGGVRWLWMPSDGLSCSDCASPRAAPETTTLYTVTAWSPAGCFGTDSVRVVVNPVPRLVVRGDTTVCAGASASLHASGATTYRWSPADGLSCVDCADPVATVTATRTWRVVGTSADGCSAIDSVTVRVARTDTVHAWADTSHRIAIGGALVIPVLVDNGPAITRESSLELEVTYDPGMLRLPAVGIVGTLLESGEVIRVAESRGWQRLRLRPERERAGDTLLRLSFRGYLADTTASRIGIVLRATSECLTVTTADGLVRLDSLCGMSSRLIEYGDGLALRAVRPNPIGSSATIEYAIPVDGHVRLRLVDAAGVEVMRAVDAALPAGRHVVTIDAAALAAGAYLVLLESGGETTSLRVVRR